MNKSTKGSSEDYPSRKLGQCLRVCQLNIEGISRAKCQVLHKILTYNKIDLVAIQETHAANEDQLSSRGKIPGYDLLGATYDNVYGVATYVRQNVENAYLISTSYDNGIQEVVTKVGETTIVNVYKPPSIVWPPKVLNTYNHPTTYLGDFNSHHEQWKYRRSNENGNALVDWAEEHDIHLIFDAKDRGTFRSGAWNTDHNPDLCFVSSDCNSRPLPVTRKVLGDFPHSQHRPILLEFGISIPLIRALPRPRWNFQKANWTIFSENLDKCVGWIPPVSSNYKRFVQAIISTAKKCIPRGFRKVYIPGWTEKCENLYKEFCETNEHEIADELLNNINAARRIKWTETVESLDFRTSSRKAWSLLRKLGGSTPRDRTYDAVTPNQVAANIVSTSRSPQVRAHTIAAKKKLKALKADCRADTEYCLPFSTEEVATAINEMKPGKAPGFDGIHTEFLLHCGKYVKQWLAEFFTNILQTGNIPHEMKRAKVIALLKPGKANDKPENYRPIALLSILYKLLERMVYNRICHKIFKFIPVEQAGFRPNRSCTDQVLSLTTFIEAGFQNKEKTSIAFIDLTAAYDTVWRPGVILKLLQVIPSMKISHLINEMLSNRCFQVIMGNCISSQMKLNNGLPQGSVLAPLLFSLYISDMPETKSMKFGYADDWALATRHKELETTETILTNDLSIIGEYFRKWRLQPSATKTEVSTFHLSNKMANKELTVHFEGKLLRHNRNPKYLGVTLDRTLSYKEHLTKTAAKIKTRNNILQKLCGTSWGSSASTLRTSALGLVYPVAEYCSPAWLNSTHTKLIDTQLNHTMRLITGTIRPTPTFWLPILSHIQPPSLRRKNALLREYKKLYKNPHLPVHEDIPRIGRGRLRSRHPPLETARTLDANNFNTDDCWRQTWQINATAEQLKMPCISTKPPGFELPRKDWSVLNRIRTNTGRCADLLYKWKKRESPSCDCGAEKQTVFHVVQECPLRAFAGDQSEFLVMTEGSLDYIHGLDISL